MFYRFSKAGARIAVDLDGLFAGSTLFLLGGSPTLKEQPLELLRQRGIVTMAMNNVPLTFPKPDLWVCADKPPCFDQRIYADPSVMKFTIITRRREKVGTTGKMVREFPNMHFFGITEKFTLQTFLQPHRDLVWWKSVFPIALQLAHRLGFRTVYLVGCGFTMSAGRQYAWKTDLNGYQQNYSQRTYNADVTRLQQLKSVFDDNGFRVISATPDSAANDILGYVSLEEAVTSALASMPLPSDTLVHSSALSKLSLPPSDAIAAAFKKKVWRGPETQCGEGSMVASTPEIREALPSLLQKYGLRRINDAGCGDMNWLRLLAPKFAEMGVDYLGYDVRDYSDMPLPYEQLELVHGKQRPCDLVLCRDVLIHLPNDLVTETLNRFREAGKYLLASSYPGTDNAARRLQLGNFARLDLEAHPFSLGKPLEVIEEPRFKRLLGLWQLQT
jgi:hypothetical protein